MQGGEDTLDFLMYLFLIKFDIFKKNNIFLINNESVRITKV